VNTQDIPPTHPMFRPSDDHTSWRSWVIVLLITNVLLSLYSAAVLHDVANLLNQISHL
jgi:hypothetical protein